MNEITVIENKVNPAIAEAQAMVISNNPQYIKATDFLKAIKALEKEVEAAFDPAIEAAHRSHKIAIEQKDKYFKPLINAEKLIKGKIGDFLAEEERKRKEEEEKLRREAEKKEAELKKKAEAARANGNEKAAEKYEEKANNVIAPTLAPTVEKVKGVTFSDLWYAEVVDLKLLPKEYMLPDMPKLNKLAEAMKDSVVVPGVVFKSKKIISSRGA
jgi:hypothetical protein